MLWKACARCRPAAVTLIWMMWKLPALWSSWLTSPAASSRNLRCQPPRLLHQLLRRRKADRLGPIKNPLLGAVFFYPQRKIWWLPHRGSHPGYAVGLPDDDAVFRRQVHLIARLD